MPSPSIGQKLVTGLTTAQTARLLDAIFELWGSSKINELLGKIDEDTAAVLSRLLHPDTEGSSAKQIVSDERYAQEWWQLWQQWEAVVMEVGDEEGDYIEQEADWEPPYFDGSAVAEDLEKIAEKMLPMLEKVYALGIEEDDVFSQALQELEESIQGYPEWMDTANSECYLNTATTRCLLQWEWLTARGTANSAATFVENIHAIESALEIIGWDESAFVDFFMGLPNEVQKQIYDHLTAHRDEAHWQGVLDSVHSAWSTVYQAYAASFDPRAYLDNCRRLLSQDWRCGRPLIDDALSQLDHGSAAQFLQQTLNSYLCRYRQKAEDWQPEDTLLITASRYDYAAAKAEIAQLLTDWIKVADHLRQTERAAALRLQCAVYEKPYQWDTIARVFHEQEHHFPALSQHLITQWQIYTVEVSVSGWYSERPENSQDSWLMWLLQAGLDQTKGEAWFAPKVKAWLIALRQNSGQFKKQLRWICLLTGDIAEFAPLAKQYPKLLQLIQSRESGRGELATSRRQWLTRLNGEQFAPVLMETWTQNIAVLVPDPATVEKANYSEHARWLDVCRELNPSAYQETLASWRVSHKRRRNLWVALQQQGLT